MQADLENLLQVNQKLGRMQLVAHRDLLFVHERIGKYQADCHCLEAQNQYLQQHIMTLAAVGAMPYTTSVAVVVFELNVLSGG